MNRNSAKTNLMWAGLPLILYVVSFYLCRFIFIDLHHMKDWPVVLFAAGLIVLLLALILKKRCLTIMTTIGYMGGFFLGMLLNTDSLDPGGGALNNWWIIWTGVFLAAVAVGVFLDVLVKRKNIKEEGRG